MWARFLIASVALIYTARLSVASLSHTLELPKAFGSFSMPDWWEPYRLLGGTCTEPRTYIHDASISTLSGCRLNRWLFRLDIGRGVPKLCDRSTRSSAVYSETPPSDDVGVPDHAREGEIYMEGFLGVRGVRFGLSLNKE